METKIKKIITLSLIFMPLLMVSCTGIKNPFSNSDNNKSNSGSIDLSVINGAPPGPTDPRAKVTVAIYKSDGTGICSGVIIGKRLIATVAHCIAEDSCGAFKDFEVVFGPSITNRTDTRYPVARYTSTNFKKLIKGTDGACIPLNPEDDNFSDYGFIYLDDDIPEGYAVAKISDKYLGSMGSMAGYGITTLKSDDYNFGELRVSEPKIFLAYMSYDYFIDGEGTNIDESKNPLMAGGDSGGPLFVTKKGADEATVVVGLSSSVGEGLDSKTNQPNGDYDMYFTRIGTDQYNFELAKFKKASGIED